MENKKAILVVVEDLRVNNSSSGIVSSTFIKFLYDSGYKVDVITEKRFDYKIEWFPKDINVEILDIPETKISPIFKIPKIKGLYTIYNGYHIENKVKLQLYKSSILDHINNYKYDYIYLLGAGHSFLPYYIFPCKEISVPYIVNIHDPYPNHLYPEPYKVSKNLVFNSQEKKFSKILEKAHKITLPSKYLLDDLAKTFPVINQKGIVIPHIGTNLEKLPTNENDDLVNLDPNKINIIHAGNLLGPRNPEFLLKAIKQVNEEIIDFKNLVQFTFFGPYNKVHEFIITQNDLTNVQFSKVRVSYKKSRELINNANANLVIEAISNFSPFMPGKLADIAFYNKPIISLTSSNSEVVRILGNDYPYHSNLNDVDQIKKVLIRFYNDQKNNIIISNDKLKEYVSIEKNSLVLKEIL